MNKRKKTYGVYNIIEWHAQLQAGKARVKVAFTGGSITTNGVTPATYTTSDPVIQLAIERSHEFKSGRIKTVRSTETKEEIIIERNPEKLPEISPEVPCDSTVASSGVDNAENDADNRFEKSESDVIQVAEVEPTESETTECNGPEAEQIYHDAIGEPEINNLLEVEFSCNDDAKDYLEETFKIVRSKLHNRDEIKAAGRANGVEIIFV